MTTTPVAQQQNQTADPEQIKNYLTQAMQALDSGNNTKAAEQVGLAEALYASEKYSKIILII